MAASTEEGTEMKRRKRFTIKLVALGLAVAALSAPPAQAKLDEGLNGLQASYTQRLVTADDIVRPSPLRQQQLQQPLVTADDVTHPSQVPSQPTVVQSDDGFELGTLGVSGIVLLLGAGAAFMAVYQGRNRKRASA
jgi:hypothetical protein